MSSVATNYIYLLIEKLITSTYLILNHLPRIGISRKHKQQLSQITGLFIESRKRQKADGENRRKKEIPKRQREEEDFGDEYEVPNPESSSDESECDKSSSDQSSSGEENMVVQNREDTTCDDSLGEYDNREQLAVTEQTLKLTWKKGAVLVWGWDKAGSWITLILFRID